MRKKKTNPKHYTCEADFIKIIKLTNTIIQEHTLTPSSTCALLYKMFPNEQQAATI